MINKNKFAFTFVEMIIAISIVVLLAVVGNSSLSTYKEKSNNSKVISDLGTLNNSLLSYSAENKELPMAGGNNNFFKEDTSYSHSWTSTGTFGAHGFITETTLPKKYLNYLPIDPATNQYYAYGRTKENLQFEVAGVILKDSEPVSIVDGNYSADNGPYNLIREYNGPDFVYNNSSTTFPYNPYEKVLTARIDDFSGSVTDIKINNSSMSVDELLSYNLKMGDRIYIATGSTASLYFSDGTSVNLGDLDRESELILSNMSFVGDTNLFTKIKLVLGIGTMWTKATSLGNDSSFEVYTTDSSAAVRGTIFGITKKPADTSVSVVDGSVDVALVDSNITNIEQLNNTLLSNSNPVPPIGPNIKTVKIGESININSTSTTITTPTTPIVRKDTFDDIGEINKSIRIKILSYFKDSSKINIKLALNKIIRKKATFLVLKAGDKKYILNKNFKLLNNLTLTGGTVFSGSGLTEIINSNNEEKIKLSFCAIKKNSKRVCIKGLKIKLIPWDYKMADIGKCPRGKISFNHECVDKPSGKLKDWKLVAYAPYDNTSTGTMYLKDGKTIPVFSSGVTYDLTGVTVSGSTDYLYYSGSELNLGNNFAIEMRVSGDNSNKINGYLFYNKEFKLNLYNSNLGLNDNNGYDGPEISSGKLLSYFNIGTFYKITAIKEGNKDTLSVGGDSSYKVNTLTGVFDNLSGLVIGANKENGYSNQFNGVIDYIKIYKK